MDYVGRVDGYSVYYDNDRLYVEDKEDSDFAAIFELPPNVESEEDMRELLQTADGHMDFSYRVRKTHGEIEDDNVPQGLEVARRAREENSNSPIANPDDEPGPPEWANPELGGQPRYPGEGNGP